MDSSNLTKENDNWFWQSYAEYCAMMNIIKSDGEPTTADEHNKKWLIEVGSETGIEEEEGYANKN